MQKEFALRPGGSVLAVQVSLLPPSFKACTSNIHANDIFTDSI